ncbi:inositol monophosphatase family protein [Legionella sp. CNM-4043-24]|uniref:inositol monophosphatase family protein n=1 Tax=Legionella sp. CNM-4043-24 TaxID=3421646 RepID=UPI00403B0142
MNETNLDRFEQDFVALGKAISSWRDDHEARSVLEPSAFKTSADLKAHQRLTDMILQHFPGATILSEEDTSHHAERPDAYWLIDPIDGTASWYHGFDGFVTQAAYIENNVPVYGAVYAPVLNRLWTAIRGKGAKRNGTPLPRLRQSSRINLIDNYPQPQRVAKTLFQAMNVSQYLECGSFGLKACMVADGGADLFVKDVLFRDWDVAPVAVILHETGGIMSDLRGGAIPFSGSFENSSGLIIARDKALHEQALAVINQHCLQDC